MVDAVDLRLGEDLAHVQIDLLGRGQVAAQRLFEHHARIGRGKTRGGQVVADLGEDLRRRGQVVHARERFIGAQGCDQVAEGARIGGVQCHIGDAADEFVPVGARRRFLDVRLRVGLDHVQEFLLRGVVAPDADDAGAGRQVAGYVAREHGRQQLAHRKVATAAKEYEVEIGNRHDELGT
jgi:hypothetical protein